MTRLFSIRHHAWTILALIIGVAGLFFFASEGLLSPPGGEDRSASILFIWFVSVILGLVGVVLAVLDTGRVLHEQRAAALYAKHLKSRSLESCPKLEHDSRHSSAQMLYRDIVRIHEHDGWLDRGWLDWAIRRTKVELAPIGGATRALAGLLMILAVLGTFAGMRDAVPELADAIQRITGAESGQTVVGADGGGVQTGPPGEQVRRALNHVSDAFGANLLALFGAVVLGIAAHGAAKGRSDILRVLSVATEREVVASGGREASGADLSTAVRAMTSNAQAVVGTKESIDSLNQMLLDFRRDLRHSLDDLGSNVTRTIQISLEEKMVGTLEATSKGLGRVAEALAATTVAYEGLLQDQDLSRKALQNGVTELERSAQKISSELQHGAEGVRQGVGKLDERIEQQSKAFHSAIGGLSNVIERADSSITEATASLGRSTDQLGDTLRKVEQVAAGQAEAVERWSSATSPYAKAFESAAKALHAVSDDTRLSAVKILDRIRESDLSVQKGFSDLARSMEKDSAAATQAIREAGGLIARSAEVSTEESKIAMKETAGSLVSASATFRGVVDDLCKSREELLGKPPVRVEISERSIERLAARRKNGRGFFGLFRRTG